MSIAHRRSRSHVDFIDDDHQRRSALRQSIGSIVSGQGFACHRRSRMPGLCGRRAHDRRQFSCYRHRIGASGRYGDGPSIDPIAVRERGRRSTSLAKSRRMRTGAASFRRGVSRYPTIGDAASILPPDMIRLVFGLPKGRSISVGRLYHDQTIEALIDVDALVARHFAILGSTGVGKSSGVAVLLNENPVRPQGHADLHARRAQRIWPMLRRSRQCPRPARAQAAVLALQLRGDRRRDFWRVVQASKRSRRFSPN